MIIVEILKKHIKNLKIQIAENGKIALERLSEQSFDLILMDIKMPVMDGYEATKAIRKLGNEVLRRIPILAVTANALPEQLQKCKDVGMDDFVTKPIDEKTLLEKINLLTQNNKNIDFTKLKKFMDNDENRAQQFLDLFKSQVPIQLIKLKKATIDKDYNAISINAHNIKSQCKYLGLNDIVKFAFDIEQLVDQKGQLDLLPDMVTDLEDRLNKIIETELT